MKIRTFRNILHKGDWEWNLLTNYFKLRVAKHQFAFWVGDDFNSKSVFNFSY